MKHFLNYVVLIILFLQSQVICKAQSDTSLVKDKFLFVPVPFYYPETRFGLILGGLYTFRPKGVGADERPSQCQLGGGYTQNKQILTYINGQVYTKNLGYSLNMELGYYRYFFPFSGIGFKQKRSYLETYSVSYPRLKAALYKRVAANLFAGIKLHYDSYNILTKEKLGLIDNGEVVGSSGGNFFMWGLGGSYDTRDNYFSSRTGEVIDFAFQISRKGVFSDFAFEHFYLNASKFYSLNPKWVLALNFYNDTYFGGVPFFRTAELGGPRNLRGFYEGQIRDNISIAFNNEIRYQFLPRFSAVAFSGIGTVSPTLDKLFEQQAVYTYGAGLRFMLDEKERLNFRVDYGRNSYGQGNFFVTFFEAF